MPHLTTRSKQMTTTLVLTVIGDDRPGLVNAVAEKIAAYGANWEETRMARLAGKFAGILLITVAPDKADALVDALGQLESSGLRLIVERGADTQAVAPGRGLRLELVCQDRPGIVRDISGLLAGQGVSIEELETEFVSGSFSGETLFQAKARLRAPLELDVVELRTLIENLANELMADISVDDTVS
jgi:glycine cleavage system regulatory protein